MTIVISNPDHLIDRFANQIGAVGEGKAVEAFARAINRAGDTTKTHVVRALVAQTSIPRAIVVGTLRTRKASPRAGGEMDYVISGTGSEIPLKEFKPRQFKAGTRAKVWGRTQTFAGAFMGPKPGVVAPGLAGHVWARTGAGRLPIQKLYGPSIPKEMVKDATKVVFETVSVVELEKRIRHELGRLLPT